jgi:hypothetical protein
MDDSEAKSTPGQPVKPAVTEEIIVRPNSTVTQVRGKGGKWVKKTTPESEAREITKNFMMAYEKGVTGRASKRRVEEHLYKMHQIMMEDYHQPVFDKMGNPVPDENGNPKMVVDARIMAAQVQVFNALQDRFVGKPSKSPEDREALKTSGIQTVLVPVNLDNLPDKKIYVDQRRTEPRPSPEFIEAEILDSQRDK